MRTWQAVALCCLFYLPAFAQPNAKPTARLLVYSLKGKATVLDNKKEVAVKIGTLLKAGTVLRTQAGTNLVLVCPQGRPISVLRKGSFPVNRWNDSCSQSSSTVSTEYFRYVWSQMTGHDSQHSGIGGHRAGHPDDIGGVVRDLPPPAPNGPIDMLLLFSGGDFPLQWAGIYGTSLYTVELSDEQGRVLYSDSSSENRIMLSRFMPYMSPGNQYYWQVSTPTRRGGAKAKLRYVTKLEEESLVREIGQAAAVPETEAEKAFRTAFMLEKRDFLIAAADWYRRAAADPKANPLFRKKWEAFRIEHRLPDTNNGNQ